MNPENDTILIMLHLLAHTLNRRFVFYEGKPYLVHNNCNHCKYSHELCKVDHSFIGCEKWEWKGPKDVTSPDK